MSNERDEQDLRDWERAFLLQKVFQGLDHPPELNFFVIGLDGVHLLKQLLNLIRHLVRLFEGVGDLGVSLLEVFFLSEPEPGGLFDLLSELVFALPVLRNVALVL